VSSRALHDALPISGGVAGGARVGAGIDRGVWYRDHPGGVEPDGAGDVVQNHAVPGVDARLWSAGGQGAGAGGDGVGVAGVGALVAAAACGRAGVVGRGGGAWLHAAGVAGWRGAGGGHGVVFGQRAARGRAFAAEGNFAMNTTKDMTGLPDEAALRRAFTKVYDPEFGVSVEDLGLIYEIDVGADGEVLVTMTLTSMYCPAGDVITAGVKSAAEAL